MKDTVTIKMKKGEITWLMGLYIMTTLYLLYFSPVCGRGKPHRSLQLIPFRTIREQLTIPHGIDAFLGNMAGNLLILLPAGFFLALLNEKLILLKIVLILLVLAFIIELGQYLLWVGCMDIDDIWMNAAGGVMGYLTGKRLAVSERVIQN